MKAKAIFTSICLGLFWFAIPMANAGGLPTALHYSGKAITNSAQAAAQGIAVSGQVVLGTVAMPLLMSGAVGQASNEIGNEFWDAATQPIGAPLEISDETVTVGPSPDTMLKNPNDGQQKEKF